MAKSPFLKMHRFGAFLTQDSGDMKGLAAFLKIVLPYATKSASGAESIDLPQMVSQLRLDPDQGPSTIPLGHQTRFPSTGHGRDPSPTESKGRMSSHNSGSMTRTTVDPQMRGGRERAAGRPGDPLTVLHSSSPDSYLGANTQEQILGRSGRARKTTSFGHSENVRNESSAGIYQNSLLLYPSGGNGGSPTPAYPRPPPTGHEPSCRSSLSSVSPAREGRQRSTGFPPREVATSRSSSQSSVSQGHHQGRPNTHDRPVPERLLTTRTASYSPLRKVSEREGRGT